MLGSARYPDRALLREQFRFFSDDAGMHAVLPPGTAAPPRVMEIVLRKTKTTQFTPSMKIISAPAAVAAAWGWFCETANRSSRAVLFQLAPDGPPLSTFALVRDLQRRHLAAGLGAIHLTGKSWRMGGASTLAIQGAEPADIAALGWTPNSHQWARYGRDP